MFKPTFNETVWPEKVKARILDVDSEEGQELATKYGIKSIPTVIAIEDGKELCRSVGAVGKAIFQKWVEALDSK
jgi:thioredoxin-like negative regulator of GroEL